MSIHTILLLPTSGSNEAVAEGACGYRPPVVMELSRGSWWAMGSDVAFDGKPVRAYEIQHGKAGLVIAYGGVVHKGGCDRAQEFYLPQSWHKHWFRACVGALLNPDDALVAEYADLIQKDKRWEVVCLSRTGKQLVSVGG